MVETSIIILTYNSSLFLEDLLESLKSFSKDAEVLVVDNSSRDDTVKKAKKYDFVNVIETGQNLGFAKGNNFGAKKASGKYILFLNPDTVFKKGEISDLISIFKRYPKCGFVGGKIIDRNGNPEKSGGRFFGLIESLLIALGLDEELGVRFSPKEIRRVDFVSGGFMMVDAKIFSKLRGFDENYFMYVEDMDICYRAKREEDKNTYFTPQVVIEHAGQGSSNRSFAIFNIYKGLLYFHKKNKNKIEYEIVKFCLWLKALAVYLLGRITNNNYYISTYGETLKLFR